VSGQENISKSDGGTNKSCPVCRQEFPAGTESCPQDGVLLSSRDPLIGSLLDDKYEILDFLGLGGMSRVYKARQNELDRMVAIKLLKSDLTGDAANIARFRREAAAASQLNHPNLGSVYALGVTPQGVAYIAMEYINGRNLSSVIEREHPFAVTRAARIGCQIAQALSDCHKHGVIHRDLKPSNIMIVEQQGDDSFVKVVDFGTAKLTWESSARNQKLTQQGEVLGTAMYMSPEQQAGEEVDARADIYALGRILFDMTAQEMKVPAALAPVVSTAMESKPADRYQTMDEFKSALEKVADDEPGSRLLSVASQLPARTGSTTMLKRLAISVLLLSSILTLVLAGTLVWFHHPSSEDKLVKIHPAEAPRSARDNLDLAEKLGGDGRSEEAKPIAEKLIADANRDGYALSPEVARAYRLLGQVAISEGRNHDAIDYYQTGLSILRRFTIGDEMRLIAMETELAQLYTQKKEYDKAKQLLDEALAQVERDNRGSDINGDVLAKLARFKWETGDASGAISTYEQAAQIDKHAHTEVGLVLLADVERNLDTIYSAEGRLPEAIVHSEKRLEALRSCIQDRHLPVFITEELLHLSDEYYRVGSKDKAKNLATEALARAKTAANALDETQTYLRLSQFAYDDGDCSGALKLAADALASAKRLKGKEKALHCALAFRQEGNFLVSQGKNDQSWPKFQEAARQIEKVNDHFQTKAEVLVSAAQSAINLNDFAAARSLLEKAWQAAESEKTENLWRTKIQIKLKLALIENTLGERQKCQQDLSAMEQILAKVSPQEKDYPEAHFSIAEWLRPLSYFSKAIQYHELARKLYQQSGNDQGVHRALLGIALDYYASDNFTEAEEHFKQALTGWLPVSRDDHRHRASAYCFHGKNLIALNRMAEAQAEIERAADDLKACGSPKDMELELIFARIDLDRGQGNANLALRKLETALSMVKAMGMPDKISAIKYQQGQLMLEGKNLEAARAKFVDLDHDAANNSWRCRADFGLSQVLTAQNKPLEAEVWLKKTIDLGGNVPDAELRKYLTAQDKLLQQLNRQSEAQAALSRAQTLSKQAP
jgi:serine/threonine protein kinase